MSDELVHVHHERKPSGVDVVYVNGNIICNISGTPVRAVIEKLIRSPSPKIVLNLRDVLYLDSYSFGWLGQMQKSAAESGGRLVISDPNTDIANLFSELKFDRVVNTFESEDEAVKSMEQ